MVCIAFSDLKPSRRRRGFTLIEILIVASLIALFSGIAMFAVQAMYDQNRRKAMFDETKQIGQALHFAYEDLGFFPRINFIGYSKGLLTYDTGGGVEYVRPGFDTYGYLSLGQKSTAIADSWHGPYMAVTEARAQLSQGQKGLAWMRIMDQVVVDEKATIKNQYNEDPTVVRWPTDTWGNPYVLYQIVADPVVAKENPTTNPLGLRLAKLGEQGDYFTAVVSYGPNGYPGGYPPTDTKNATPLVGDERLKSGALYVVGDLLPPQSDSDRWANFTLRVAYPSGGQVSLSSADFLDMLPETIHNNDSAKPGIIDPGSDDVFWRF